MEVLTDEDLNDARKQAPLVPIDGLGVDTNPPGNGVCLVLRKASNGGMKIYSADAESMLNALHAAVRKMKKPTT